MNKVIKQNFELIDIDRDSLGNLCQLDQKMNSSLRNSALNVKRKQILQKTLEGHYIPNATRPVFLKALSKSTQTLLLWQEADAKDCLANIQATLDSFKD